MDAAYTAYRELRIARNKAKRLRIVRRQRIILGLILALIIFVISFFVTSLVLNAREKAPSYKYYTSITVAGGDTLYDIARKYITSEYSDIDRYVKEVSSINHLEDDCIYAGENIIVPYYSNEYK